MLLYLFWLFPLIGVHVICSKMLHKGRFHEPTNHADKKVGRWGHINWLADQYSSSLHCTVVANIFVADHGKTSKFNFCGPRFPHSLTESNYIVCDFCRSLTSLSWLSI